MKKGIYLLMIGGLLGIAFQYSSAEERGRQQNPLEVGKPDSGQSTRPRAPRHASAFQIWYEPGLNAVLVISSTDVGLVQAVIENLSTGASYICSFDSSVPTILPISGEPGVWRVVLRYSLDNVFTYTFNE